MSRVALWFAFAVVGGAALSPLWAQKPPQNKPPPAAAAHPTGQQPATPNQGKVFQPAPAAAQPAAPATAGAAPATPEGQPGAAVTPQAARPAGVPVSPNSAFTSGLAMTPFDGGTADAALEYARRLGQMLDSTLVSLVEVFRNTSGQPMVGANSPAALSQRERDRWSRCRNFYWDLTTYVAAIGAVRPSLPARPALQQAATALDSALGSAVGSEAPVAECDNVASMVAAPERWTPWQDQYENSARRFYRDFYDQIRDVHERDRAFIVALNAAGPASRRLSVPAGLPRNPPYAGVAPN